MRQCCQTTFSTQPLRSLLGKFWKVFMELVENFHASSGKDLVIVGSLKFILHIILVKFKSNNWKESAIFMHRTSILSEMFWIFVRLRRLFCIISKVFSAPLISEKGVAICVKCNLRQSHCNRSNYSKWSDHLKPSAACARADYPVNFPSQYKPMFMTHFVTALITNRGAA